MPADTIVVVVAVVCVFAVFAATLMWADLYTRQR